MKIKIIAILFLALLFNSCDSDNQINTPVPNVPVNLTINLDLPLYQQLNFIGSYVYEIGGYNGIVIIHHTDGNFYAVDRTCTFDLTSSCNNIEMNMEKTRLICGNTAGGGFQECCGSQFFTNGAVLNGPATYPLKSYRVTKSGTSLYISN